MTNFIYFYGLLLLFFNINDARKPNDPLQGTNSICADVCTSSEAHVELDLSQPRIYREHEYVQIKLFQTGSGPCREPALLEIPLDTIGKHGIIKFDLDFGPVLHNFSIDIGFNDENNKTIRSVNVVNQQVSIEYHSDDENKTDIYEQSVTLLEPGESLSIFISNDWIFIDNEQRKQQTMRVDFNQSNSFLFNQYSSVKYLSIGLNRNINGKQTGIGLCLANITFIECYTDQQSALDIDVNNKTFEQYDLENITWISHLTYLDPNADIRECTAQGVVRLTFDPYGSRRIARFDLTMGSQIQGFTFNIGDSPTNNGYGGDGGTTSNSAEIHSNDNRFYVWANTKICGDTLLLKIDYNVIEPYDNITILISNERIELTNHRSYHQILNSPYLYALAKQNVTCNCFDSVCYPGVQPDNDVYFGINRVIGGTYRPGIGVCNAYVNWIQCKKIEVSPRIKPEPIVTTTTTTTTTTTEVTTVKVEETTINSSIELIDVTTRTLEHGNEMIMTTEFPSLKIMTEESNQTHQDYSSSTFVSIPSTMVYFEEITTEQEITSTESMFDYMKINQANNEEQTNFTIASESINEEETSTVSVFSNRYRLFHLLANLSQDITMENTTSESILNDFNSTIIENDITTTTPTTTTTTVLDSSASSTPCTLENLLANFVYHEYPLDKHKFIFCDSEGKMNIIACSPNYIWSQSEQSCILPN
ncbi:unnamed protein product [Rotaria sordida]|uniref:Chitin-binding type-2 domain-containing protein n=1 Tax=Rotaria sordida TaxID=392033 RepID=A0A818PQ55_9BILA|nr:unnamed protein product [Rotaria sordida]CAF1277744.1 unnamed protein product [Rotaria sordida]CAF3627358.1 unnamed protein product [Rotaria sordida]CAF3632218.1 unnamed protein product [Rotaria sordida]